MKNKWSAPLLAHITKGTLKGSPNWVASTFTHDSRKVEPGQLYVAIKGEKVDGHAYIQNALQQGAVAALVDHVPQDLPADAPLLVVPSVEQALNQIGRYVRTETKAKVFAITGSSGKTTTKDMLYLALQSQVRTHRTPASFNSRWGLPLTLSAASESDQALILEMGMNAPGEIKNLTNIGLPDIAIITTINPAHIEKMKTLDQIAHEKGSIFGGLKAHGTAIIPSDVAERQILVEHAHQSQAENIILFGESPLSTYRLTRTVFTESGMTVSASLGDQAVTYNLSVQGKHFALNSLAVLAAVKAAGYSIEKAIEGLKAFKGASGRGEAKALQSGILLLDESYNANPGSMAAALEAFAERPIQGKKYLVLGQMGELGPDSARYHKALKEVVLKVHPEHVFTYGDSMTHLYAALKDELSVTHADQKDDIIKALKTVLKPGDALLIKGSNSLNLGEVAKAFDTN